MILISEQEEYSSLWAATIKKLSMETSFLQPLHSQLNFQVKVQHHLLHLAVVRLQVQVARLQALAVARLPQARPVLVDHPALVRQALVSLALQALLARLAVLVAARQVVLEVVLAVQLTHKQPTTPGRRLDLSWS